MKQIDKTIKKQDTLKNISRSSIIFQNLRQAI